MNSVRCCGDQFKPKKFGTSLWKKLLHLFMAHILRIHDPDEKEGTWSMVQKNGTQFTLNDQPFYVNGFNTYWLMIFAADETTRGKVTELFEHASALNLSVCRTWAFNDGQYRALQKSPSVYDEEVFKYVKWGKDDGLNLACDDDFFSHPTIKSYYKAHVYTVLNIVNTVTNITYKDDPTIFAWELMNEPRCESDPSGDKLQTWIEEMSAYVKSIDPKHLLEIGLEGFYGPSTPNKVQCNPNTYYQRVGTDFIRNHQVLGVDFASVHIYSDWFSQPISDESIEFIESWMQSHIDDGENILGMPVLFPEFGVSTKDPGYNDTYRHTFITTIYRTILNSTKKGSSGGGSLLWQLFPEDEFCSQIPSSTRIEIKNTEVRPTPGSLSP
ncbi:hypothetical protein ACS0TY_015303 [Phlomoides rotata]